jgi:hypothetical protein
MPIRGGSHGSPDCAVSHLVHSGHHDPSTRAAVKTGERSRRAAIVAAGGAVPIAAVAAAQRRWLRCNDRLNTCLAVQLLLQLS